uniref:Uncharacterized protein n=1 Tax=Arundo donax TaxID=35708 RepID=A0A0A9A1M7_ARUDO
MFSCCNRHTSYNVLPQKHSIAFSLDQSRVPQHMLATAF